MEKLQFTTTINAPKNVVWSTLWEDASYRKWTSVFSPTSHAVSDWKEGSKILFLDGSGSGMVSKIEANRPYDFMSFKHLGEVRNGEEDTESEKVKAWAGSYENYTLTENNSITELLVEIDISAEHKEMFLQMFPKALEQVKQLSEKS